MKKNAALRAIPAVEKVLRALGSGSGLPRPVLTALVRQELSGLRRAKAVPDFETVVARIRASAETLRRSRIQPVINGTGILVHTNLGRAPLGPSVEASLRSIATSYNNLEYDLTTGGRGNRASYLENNLAILCGAEATTVVNNCAAAYVLILRHLTSVDRPEVIISRGELPQIGGAFRIPEILEAAGATLREVGTTNKTTLQDYAKAISPRTALILKVHQSNFFIGGFVASPEIHEVAALAKKKRIPFVQSIGSGALVDTSAFEGVEHEPTPQEMLKRGPDLVCFSGDKLMGGPQAGIIAGRRRMIRALKNEPLFRALRCDKLILAALQTTVDAYLSVQSKEIGSEIPLLGMFGVSNDELRDRAEKIMAALGGQPVTIRPGKGKAKAGGGSLPQSVIVSTTLDMQPRELTLADLAERLRHGSPPVIGYISGGVFKIDLRTVFPRQDDDLVKALSAGLMP